MKNVIDIGDNVCIIGDHPHAGRSGIIEGVYSFKFSNRKAVKIDFPDGDGCFVFQDGKVSLQRVDGK